MAEQRHTAEELKQWQALPLEVKVGMTMTRIRQWVNEFCEDGVYISFSGGKDSMVLSHLVDRVFPGNQIPRLFVNTGLEFPEIVQFVKKEPRAVIVRPQMNFKQIIQRWGYPMISKQASKCISEAKNGGKTGTNKLKGINGYEHSKYSLVKWNAFLRDDSPKVSSYCCNIMKKQPAHRYDKETGRVPMTAEQARESQQREQQWMNHGCNGFDLKHPKSTPMAFWTENDVLQYIKENGIQIASVYGDIVADTRNENVAYGQMRIEDFLGGECKLRTTGCTRTGCMFCGYGCHLEKPGEGRFLRMKHTHPKLYEYIMKPWSDGGLGYKEVIDWINEHGGFHIEY